MGEQRKKQRTIITRTAKTAVAAMLTSTMCLPATVLAQESSPSDSTAISNDATTDAASSHEIARSEAPEAENVGTISAQSDSEPVTEFAPSVSTGEDAESTLTYSIDENGNATITGTTDTETKRGLVIPEEINGYPVIAIQAGAFWGNWMETLYIPDSVTSIGKEAFGYQSQLQDVRLPHNDYCQIGHYYNGFNSANLFEGCTSLKTLFIPKGITGDRGIDQFEIGTDSGIQSVVFEEGRTSIPSNCLFNCSSLAEVSIPDSVTEIGSSAFYGCKALKSILLPSSLQSIQDDAFHTCVSLQSVNLPDSTNYIGSSSFADCESLTNFQLPNNELTICRKASQEGDGGIFAGCTSLEQLHIPANIKVTGSNVGWVDASQQGALTAPSLKSVSFSTIVDSIDHGLFTNCPSLESLNIPNSINSIGEFAFAGCSSLKSLALPEDCLLSSSGRIFLRCDALTSLYIPKGIKSTQHQQSSSEDFGLLEAPNLETVTCDPELDYIPSYLFANCPSLSKVTLPARSFSIAKEGSLFLGCTSLRSLSINSDISYNPAYVGKAPLSAPALEEIVFSDDVTSIAQNLLANCPSLKSADLPNSVKSIGAYAFSGDTALEYVHLPENDCEIGSEHGGSTYGSIFNGCTSLETLLIPKGTSTLLNGENRTRGYQVFSAPALKNVTFGEGFDSLSESMFQDCKALESISIPDGIKTIPSNCFSNCSSLANVDIPDSIRTIKNSAFYGCGFTSISLPDTVKELGNHAFANCTSLASVNLPKKGVELGGSYHGSSSSDGTFAGCTALKSIVLPDGITGGMLGAPALTEVKFAAGVKKLNGLGGCTALTAVNIPDSVRKIEANAFSGCTALYSISVPEGVTTISNCSFQYCRSLKQVDLPSSLREIGYYAFDSCTTLGSIQLPADVTEINRGAFSNCTSLESVTLPSNIRSIQSNTFEGCVSLKSIDVPLSVQSIYQHAFYKCYDLTSATITPGTTNISDDAFDLSGLENGKVICVAGSAVDKFAKDAGFNRKYYKDSNDYHNVANASVSLSSYDVRFDGSSVEPQPRVYIGAESLSSWSDFDVSYENNTAPGTATMIITGKGNYYGMRMFRFQIDEDEQSKTMRLAGDSAAETSAQIAEQAFPEGSEWVVVARDDDFADAMSATGLAGALNAPIVLTDRFGLSDAAADAVQKLGAKKAYVIGGKGAIPADLEGQLAGAGCQVQGRVYGECSWDTSVECAKKIAEHGGNPNGDAVVAMSGNFQDALSISSFAYKYQVPILLETDEANGRRLTDEAASLVAGLAGTVYVPGGTGAVPESSVEGTFGESRVVRLAGWDGYDTSNQIATYMVEHDLLSTSTVCLASGAPDPKGVDALAGAALAGKSGGVVLLTNTNARFGDVSTTTVEGFDSEHTPAFLASHAGDVNQAYILGGKAVMPADLQQKVNDILG